MACKLQCLTYSNEHRNTLFALAYYFVMLINTTEFFITCVRITFPNGDFVLALEIASFMMIGHAIRPSAMLIPTMN